MIISHFYYQREAEDDTYTTGILKWFLNRVIYNTIVRVKVNQLSHENNFPLIRPTTPSWKNRFFPGSQLVNAISGGNERSTGVKAETVLTDIPRNGQPTEMLWSSSNKEAVRQFQSRGAHCSSWLSP